MINPGQVSMWLGLIAVGISCLVYSYIAFYGKDESTNVKSIARLSFIAFTACITVASLLLMHYILNHEFVYSYISRYSSRDLPLIYLVSSFWAGQEGSFLLWVFLGAWLGIFLMYQSGRQEPRIMLIYNLSNVFLMILLIKQSPFRMVPLPPPDGNGMNMLLQDPWMAIHPPIVFLGYAAYAIPFAYAVSAWWSREYDAWIGPGLPWAIFAYVTLGAGIIIGGFWSYKVLGWGGYWGWDPVENASLLPWLAGTALVHGMILQHAQKRLQKTNFLLAAFSFILVIYCTFLTRSGILADFSVHSFLDLGITGWLVLFMGIFIAISLGLFLMRAGDIPEPQKKKNIYFSRGFGLIGAMTLLCLSCLVTGLGTSAPLITRMMEKASKVSTDFYVQTNLPLAVLMLLLLSFVPLMTWGKNDMAALVKKLPWAIVGAIAALGVTLFYGLPDVGVLCIAILAGATTGMNLVLGITLMRKRFTISSGAMVHFGVGLMFLGIVSSSVYDRSEKNRFPQGVATATMGYDMTFQGPRFMKHGKGSRLEIPLSVTKGSTPFTAQPDIYAEKTASGKTNRFVHPYIKRGLVRDLYISPVDYDPGEKPQPPNHMTIKKGATLHRSHYAITFESFEIPKTMGSTGMHSMRIGAKITVSYQDDDPVTLTPILDVGKLSSPEGRVQLPGPDEAFVTLTRINAGSKTITLAYDGPGSDTEKDEKQENQKPSVILDVSVKPGMTVLWVGTFLMLFGGIVGMVRRWPKNVE